MDILRCKPTRTEPSCTRCVPPKGLDRRETNYDAENKGVNVEGAFNNCEVRDAIEKGKDSKADTTLREYLEIG